MEIRVYQKENNIRFWALLKASLKDLYTSRFLAKQLAVRDIKAQYRQSYLGIIWAFIAPLTTAFVWIFLNSSGTISLADTGIPYPVYAFSGTLLWSIIRESINLPAKSTSGAKSILSKINFPKEALVLSGVYKMVFNSSIKLVLLIIFVFVFGVGFHWSILLIPFAIFGGVFFGLTIGLFITPLSMLYNDVSRIVGFGLNFLMYVTPVVYVIPKTGILKTLMEINPLTPIIVTMRDLIVGTNPEYLSYFFLVMLICLPLFFMALVFYRISIPIIVERMNA